MIQPCVNVQADDRVNLTEEVEPLFASQLGCFLAEEQELGRAVLLTHCALEDTVTCRDSLVTVTQQRAYRVVRVLAPFSNVLLCIYLISYIFEVPAWCWLRDESCGAPDTVMRSPLSSSMPLMSSRLLQMVCLLIFLSQTVAEHHALGLWRYRHILGVSVAMFALLDTFVALFNNYGLPPKQIYWSPLLRPFVFLGQNRSIRRFIGGALPAIANRTVIDLVLLQGIFLFVWAWFGILLFGGTPEGDEYFDSYGAALLSLFTVFTTANFPDVMMITYNKNRWTFTFFATYVVVSLYVILNVLLAALFSSYKSRMQAKHEGLKMRREETLSLAFEVLVATEGKGPLGGLSLSTWKSFCSYFCQTLNLRWEDTTADVLFNVLADPPGRVMSEDSFLLVAPELIDPSVLLAEVTPPKHNLGARTLGVLHWSVDITVVLSLIITVVHTHDFLAKERPVWESDWWVTLFHVLVCCLYLVEAVVRINVLGRSQVQSLRWLTDLFLAVTCSFLEGTLHLFGPSSEIWAVLDSRGLDRMLVLLRAARIERVLWRFEGPRSAMQLLLALFSTFKTAGAAMFFIFYLYSTVGVQVFGGRITTETHRLQHTSFATTGHVGYWANNFNDFASGIVVLFELMVVNNWYVIAEALAVVSPGPHYVGWLFCISFYFCLHIVILNILVTSVVESYERLHMAVKHHSIMLRSGSRTTSAGPDSMFMEPDKLLLGPIHGLSVDRLHHVHTHLDEEALLHNGEKRSSCRRKEKLQQVFVQAQREDQQKEDDQQLVIRPL